MAHTRMALSRRGPGVKPASSKADAGAHCRLQVSIHQQACGRPGLARAMQRTFSSSLSTPRRLRRSGSTRSGLEPGPCGHCTVESIAQDIFMYIPTSDGSSARNTCHASFVLANQRPRQNDVLENSTLWTRLSCPASSSNHEATTCMRCSSMTMSAIELACPQDLSDSCANSWDEAVTQSKHDHRNTVVSCNEVTSMLNASKTMDDGHPRAKGDGLRPPTELRARS